MPLSREEQIEAQTKMFGCLYEDIDDAVRAMIVPCYNEYSQHVIQDAQHLIANGLEEVQSDPRQGAGKFARANQLMNVAKYCASKAAEVARKKETASRKEIPSDDRVKLAIRILAEEVNGNRDYKKMSRDMLESMSSQHRTLQSSTFRLISEFIKLYAVQDDYMYDPRNEQCGVWAKAVAEATQDIHFPYI